MRMLVNFYFVKRISSEKINTEEKIYCFDVTQVTKYKLILKIFKFKF